MVGLVLGVRLLACKSARLSRGAFFSVGELALLGAVACLCGATFAYWGFSHNYNSYWPDGPIADSERFARCFGQLAVLLM